MSNSAREVNLANYFRRYAWASEQLEENLWRSSFAVGDELEFDLYVMLGEDLIHFAVSPFVAAPEPDCRQRLYEGLLRLNQQMRLVYFALDEEGDVNLLATLARRGCSFALFAATMDCLVGYTQGLAPDAARLAREQHFFSSVIPG
jgi:hypothetical protein